MDEYAEAKFRIFANQGPGDTFVGNLDDPIVAARAGRGQHAHSRARAVVRARAAPADDALPAQREVDRLRAADRRPAAGRNHAADEIPLLGAHNVDNVMAAILVGLAAGLDRTARAQRCASSRRCRTGSKPSPIATASSTSTIRRRRIPVRSSPRCARSTGRSC